MKNQWVQEHLTDAKTKLPFSFVYDGKASAGLLPEWSKKVESGKVDANRPQRTMTWTDPKTGLEVHCVAVEYTAYPTIEWTLYFKNGGDKDTPILSDIQAVDTVFEKESLLHHFKGDSMTKDSFEPLVTPLTSGVEKRFASAGGRPSNGEWPYYNVEWKGGGVILAVGWPGQWASRFSREQAQGVRIRAGQELTRFTLHPGEEVRTPLIALMFYQTGWLAGQNLWRRWMLAQNFPKDRGRALSPKLAGFCGNNFPGNRTVNSERWVVFSVQREERFRQIQRAEPAYSG